MSGAEPLDADVPAVLLPGEAMDAVIASIARLAPADPVIIGGLAVMSRVGGEHRPTLDIDTAFDNETDTPTTAVLVAQGIATDDDAIQRVRVSDVLVDVIDTSPIEPDDLPDEPKDRLLVCSHRYAYESATPIDVVGDTNRVTVKVATIDALIAMKAHALRFGRAERWRRKPPGDLYDVVCLRPLVSSHLVNDRASRSPSVLDCFTLRQQKHRCQPSTCGAMGSRLASVVLKLPLSGRHSDIVSPEVRRLDTRGASRSHLFQALRIARPRCEQAPSADRRCRRR